MTTPAPARALVSPPPLQPARYGLFSAARRLHDPNPHEYTGIEYDATCGNAVEPYVMQCETPPPGWDWEKKRGPAPELVRASPFAVYASWACPLVGLDLSETEQRLRQRLELGEEHRVEEIIETGQLGNRPALTQDTAVLDTSGSLTVADAAGVLAQWIKATFGALGVLHAPRWTQPRLHSVTHPSDDDGSEHLEDAFGNRWAFGSGYVGLPPAGHADDGALWLYGTGPVTVRRSGVIQPATPDSPAGSTTLDTRTNQNFWLVERIYVVDWPCAAAAVKTNLKRVVAAPPAEQLTVDWQPAADNPMAIDLSVHRD